MFQNYALYPHMTVEQNIGFGLRPPRTPKAEVRSKVKEAAQILGLHSYLSRKPPELSGGSASGWRSGGHMVREPKAFLMDEPLSNLHAKLWVQMRAELAHAPQPTRDDHRLPRGAR